MKLPAIHLGHILLFAVCHLVGYLVTLIILLVTRS